MKATTLVGILLIILGVVGLAYPRINYTTREKVVDLGPIEASMRRSWDVKQKT